MPRNFTVSACQYIVTEINTFEDFITKVRILLNKSQGADVVIFPELFTLLKMARKTHFTPYFN